ncbi:hypothetical protein [Thermus hydrothermalis]|nr:hypothetical protein [Thermus hydrothermalis]
MRVLHKLAKALHLPELPEALEAGDQSVVEEAVARVVVMGLA